MSLCLPGLRLSLLYDSGRPLERMSYNAFLDELNLPREARWPSGRASDSGREVGDSIFTQVVVLCP